MRVLISGASGLIGNALQPALQREGHTVGVLRRGSATTDAAEHTVGWDPGAGSLDESALSTFAPDAVIHLAGEPLAQGRWSAAKRTRILRSRVDSTRLLAASLSRLATPPSVVLGASAIGIYGDRGDETLTEDASPGEGFLAQVCQEWEAAWQPLTTATATRLVLLRTGIVLTPLGGALAPMLPAFRLGVAGRLGGGRQWMSWISLPDTIRAMLFVLETPTVAGPVNLVADALRNADFTRILAAVLKRPAVLPLPRLALKALMGRKVDDLLFASTRVVPAKLHGAGFVFHHDDLATALSDLLGLPPRR